MRKQIAAANWKMNLTYKEAEELFNDILNEPVVPQPNQLVLFGVPFPYLIMANSEVSEEYGYNIAAQNCSDKVSGAFTGEVSAAMLQSIGIHYCIIGHSERREYFNESNSVLAEKINRCLQHELIPIFCCGEPLEVREKDEHNNYVKQQLEESLFHLPKDQLRKIVIAYEPIWAIGTGKTATTGQVQEMHAFIRSVLENKWGKEVAEDISILYGGSVKASNAKEIFDCPDVDGGLVGGASLIASDFKDIIKTLKHTTY